MAQYKRSISRPKIIITNRRHGSALKFDFASDFFAFGALNFAMDSVEPARPFNPRDLGDVPVVGREGQTPRVLLPV